MDWQQISDTAASLWVVWLMLLFIGIVAWAYWPSHKDRFRSYGDIPLRDEDLRDNDQRDGDPGAKTREN